MNWKSFYKRIPKQVKVGQNTYEVVWNKGFSRDKKQLGETRFFNENPQIVINLNQPIEEAVHTYFHELLHIFSEEYGARLTENQVIVLEQGLKDILAPNNIFTKGVKSDTTKPRKR